MTSTSSQPRISFCVGTGRCGTTLITKLAGLDPEVAASHERLRLPACYHMFCKWHGIPTDPEGFLVDREAAIADDLKTHRFSFESSALISHSIAELYQRFDATFLLLVRRPDHTVGSFAVRGWFEKPIPWADTSLPPTIPEGVEPRHFFGRNLPRSPAEFERWRALSNIGRLAWFWNARNRAILEQFRDLPAARRRIVRLEDLDLDHFRGLAHELGWNPQIDEPGFAALVGGRINTGPNHPLDPRDWAADDAAEFEAELGVLANALGYEHRIDALTTGTDPRRGPAPEVDEVLSALDSASDGL